MTAWISAFDASSRPTILDIRAYLSPEAMALLDAFNQKLNSDYRVKGTPAHYTKHSGWVIPYCLRGVTFFSLTIRDEACFCVGEAVIRDQTGLQTALAELDRQYHSGFSQKAEAVVATRKERAKQKRLSGQTGAERVPAPPPPGSDPEKLNKFHWVPALSPAKLRALYRSSASGALNSELLDEVGILFYARCKQGTEEYALLRSGKLKCHQCGAIHPNREGLLQCVCGSQYTFQEYVYSFNGHHMPGGNAQHIFEEYVEKWPKARTDSQKMNLIDWMIHECHVSMSSGLPLRSTLKNLINASTAAAGKLILELAYGDVGAGT